MKSITDKAVILARGLGSRMRSENSNVLLTAQQRAAAQKGDKGMMPIRRPFLDYILHMLADAGYRRVCLVIGPGPSLIRAHFAGMQCQRLEISFAIQQKPLGTADAVTATEEFAGNDFFLTLNADNYYPLDACRALRELNEAGVAAFDRQALIQLGNISPERVAKYAILNVTGDGYLDRVIEKPDPQFIASLKPPVGVSLNCWMFPPEIFQACREIGLSSRGEYELTDAVNYLSGLGKRRFRVLPFALPVLDLSCPDDIPAVVSRLFDLEVNL